MRRESCGVQIRWLWEKKKFIIASRAFFPRFHHSTKLKKSFSSFLLCCLSIDTTTSSERIFTSQFSSEEKCSSIFTSTRSFSAATTDLAKQIVARFVLDEKKKNSLISSVQHDGVYWIKASIIFGTKSDIEWKMVENCVESAGKWKMSDRWIQQSSRV